MKMKVIFTFIILLSILHLASAQLTVGYDFTNPSNKVVIEIPDEYINQSLVTVNNTIYWNGYLWDSLRWLNIDGSNANQNIDISPYNLTTSFIISDGRYLTNLNFSSYYPHDQDLNTTSNVQFNTVDANNYTGTYLNVTNGTFKYLNVTESLYVKNSTIYLGNVSISSYEYPDGTKIVTFGDSFVNATGYFGDGGFLDNITFANGTVTANGFTGLTFNGGNFTGNNFTGDTFNGWFNWTAPDLWLDFDGYTLYFNESNLLDALQDINATNITLDSITLNGTTIYSWEDLFPRYDQNLNTTSNVTFNAVTSDFKGTYDWTTEYPWLNFNGTYLTFNETHLQNIIQQVISNYTFTNLTVTNINITDSITLNESTITDWSTFEVNEYEETILISTSGGSGSNQSVNLINFEITQIIVTPTTLANKYKFEAIESTTGSIIDRNRRQHIGEWNIYKSHTINDKVNVSISNANIDETFTVTIKYIDNYR